MNPRYLYRSQPIKLLLPYDDADGLLRLICACGNTVVDKEPITSYLVTHGLGESHIEQIIAEHSSMKP